MHLLQRVALVVTPLVLPIAVFAASGSLTVTATPVQDGSVAQGAQRVPLLSVRFQATCAADVTVRALTLRHSGLGATSDILRAYVLEQGQRRSHAVTLPAHQPMVIRTTPIVIAACQTKVLTVAVDIAPTAQAVGEHRLTLDSVEADAPVTVANAQSAAVNAHITPHASQSSVTAVFRPVLTSVSYGDNRVVARLLLTGGSSTDQNVLSITFTNDGSAANADLQSIYLETASGQQLSKALSQMDGRVIHITFDQPYLLQRNEAKLVQLRANVRASRTHTIQFTIEEPSDIEAVQASR